jgi:hypothetical protein
MILSSVFGILDPYGGLRVVVTAGNIEHHARPYEIAIVVPDLKIREPVPWGKIPWLIHTVENHVDWWIAVRNDPDTLANECIVMRKLRMSRAFNRGSVDLCDIVET